MSDTLSASPESSHQSDASVTHVCETLSDPSVDFSMYADPQDSSLSDVSLEESELDDQSSPEEAFELVEGASKSRNTKLATTYGKFVIYTLIIYC